MLQVVESTLALTPMVSTTSESIVQRWQVLLNAKANINAEVGELILSPKSLTPDPSP